ncbi:MBL fold metallo-hydrolase [Halarchaeum sp. P4]|uniref:MBL fold metallo-hydrolase n=1 Tax=Halarchaeum sp. P4 TaxID=3421639 RepID=UPI003EB754CE
MRVTFLGTGSAIPTGERVQSGLRVEAGGATLLVDCGSGVLDALVRAGTDPADVDAVLLTHHHLDHVSDLLPLLKARWLAANDTGTLPVAGPPGTIALVDGLLDVHDYLDGRVAVDPRDIARDSVALAGLDVERYETEHSASMQSFAYRLESALTVSGDTLADHALAAFAEGTTLVHDCAHPDGHETTGHPTPSELGAVLADHEYRGVYLTHLYPDADAAGDALADAVREHYEDDVTIAEDGLTVEV